MTTLYLAALLVMMGLLGCAVHAYPSGYVDYSVNTHVIYTYTNSHCEGYNVNINCPPNSKIEITSANYGRNGDPRYCVPYIVGGKRHGAQANDLSNADCIIQSSTAIVENLCEGRNSCVVKASQDVFGTQCSHVNRYLEVVYTCVAN